MSAAACFASAAEDLQRGGRHRASKLSRTLLRGTRGRGDACVPGAGCGADGAALGGLPGGGAPLRPPRQWRPHDCAHQRIIASRDISADTGPARGRGEGSARLPPQWVTRTSRFGCCASAPRHQRGTPLLSRVSRSPGPQCHPQAGPLWRAALRQQRWLDTKRACCPPLRPAPCLGFP